MSSDEFVDMINGGILTSILFLIFINFVIIPSATENFQKKAIERGVAEYYINKENEKEFRFLDCEK